MKKYIIILAIFTSGCTTTARMNVSDLNQFTIDCTKKQEQIAFLQSQWPSDKDRFVNAMTLTSTAGFILSNADGTYQERRKVNDGYLTNALRIKIDQIRNTCANY